MTRDSDKMEYLDASRLPDREFFEVIAQHSPNEELNTILAKALESPERAATLRSVLTAMAVRIISEEGN